jgi:hypothetical protein
VKKQGGLRALMVEGPLDFSLTGVLVSLSSPLARNGISIFSLSTYDTDYILVKEEQVAKAVRLLGGEGYDIDEGCAGVEGTNPCL